MFQHEPALRGQEAGSNKDRQSRGGVARVHEIPGRIREYEVELRERGEAPEPSGYPGDVPRQDLRAIGDRKGLHVGMQDAQRLAGRFDEGHPGGAAGERLEAERPGTGVKVEDSRFADDVRGLEDAEQGLPDAIRGRACRLPPGRLKGPGAVFPAGDTQCAEPPAAEPTIGFLQCACLRRYPRGMTRAIAFAFMVLGALNLFARPALAEPPNSRATPVYVLSIWTNDADDQAEALTQQLRSRVRQASGWSLLETTQSFETLAIALRCPPTPSQPCLDRIGEQLHADHYVWGTMAKEKAGEVTADIRMWTRGKPSIEASESYSENLKDPSDDGLRAIAGRLIAKVTSGGAPTGTLVVHAGTGRGTVVVDGSAKGTLDGGAARINVAAGQHTVAVRVSGFQAESQTAAVTEGGEADLNFALSPQESGSASGSSAAEAEPETSGPRAGPPVRRIIAYSTLVAGAGFLVVAGIEAAGFLGDQSASNNDRANIPTTTTNVCSPTSAGQPALTAAQLSSAQDACQKSNAASSASTMGWVFTGVGAALVGTGLVLLLTDPGTRSTTEPAQAILRTPPRPRLDVLPTVGPRGGMLDLRVTF